MIDADAIRSMQNLEAYAEARDADWDRLLAIDEDYEDDDFAEDEDEELAI